jgi:hypothetical protein
MTSRFKLAAFPQTVKAREWQGDGELGHITGNRAFRLIGGGSVRNGVAQFIMT